MTTAYPSRYARRSRRAGLWPAGCDEGYRESRHACAPATDAGLMPNLKMSFSDTHMRLNHGGWSREITVRDLPIATTLAGVNMSLTPGGVRELHWHQQAEWAYMIWGARITAMDASGRNFIADVGPGDLWYFPAGLPTRSRDSRKAVNSCWFSMTATSQT